MNKLTIVIYSVLFVIGCVAFYIYLATVVRPELEASIGSDLGVTENIPKEYQDILPETVKKQIIYSNTYLNKIRNPISFLSIANGNVERQILIYKVDLLNKLSVTEAIKEYKSSGWMTSGAGTVEIAAGPAQISFNPVRSVATSKIYLEVDDYRKYNLLKNDSLAYFYVEDGDFNIKYAGKSSIDLYTEKPEFPLFLKKSIIYLLFYKRDKSVFIIIMGVKRDQIENKYLLLDIFFPGRTF